MAELPESVSYCDPGEPTLRFKFNWDSIFTLPEDDEENDTNVGKSPTDEAFEVLQWICCVFSIITLIFAICVFASSARVRHPLPPQISQRSCLV